MSQGTSDPIGDSAARSSIGQTDPLCNRFEGAWNSAPSEAARPHIQDYLATIPESERSAAFCSLLALELKCRHGHGEQPTQEEYHEQFPEAAALIRAVFAETGIDHRESDVHPTMPYTPSGKSEGNLTEGLPGTNGEGKLATGSTDPLNRREQRALLASARLPSVPGYQVLMELGKGGMGIVYKARDLKLKRLVALKMIHPGRDLSFELLERFKAEAAVVAQFQHPHLVQIYEIGEYDGKPYFSLELLEGGSLHKKLAATPQPPAEAAATVETLARAVDYAHKKDIVHRDLKPSNILLTADGTLKVTDFGLAKRLDQDSSQTEDGVAVGTPSYMAPEQAWGRNTEVSFGADIYALGVILYEMLTGRPPFKAADKMQTLEMVKTEEPVSPRNLVPQVPRDLELICLKCLKKDPHERFASALELADELRRFQEGRPILTRPTPLWERASKWTRRNPTLAGLIGVSVLALLSVMLYLGEWARVAQGKLDEQNRVSNMRSQAEKHQVQAEQAAKQGNLGDARENLKAAFAIITPEPSLVDLKAPLNRLQTEVARMEAERADKTKSNETYTAFLKLRDEALFHGMVFTGVDLPTNVEKTQDACKKALRLYQLSSDAARGVPVFTKFMSPDQKILCTEVCYELLLVLAEAEAPSEPGMNPTSAQLDRALHLLKRAHQLGISTRAYHLRLARYLELQKKSSEATNEEQLANKIPPQRALDHFLIGISHQKKGERGLADAAESFAEALNKEPEHFWARYFLGVCNLRLLRSREARDNFTDCMRSDKSFVWLYLLRGLAHGQMGDFRAAESDYAKALTLKPDENALYGIRVNQGVLRMRQASLHEGYPPSLWPDPMAPNLDFALRGAAEACRREKLSATAIQFLRTAVELQKEQYLAYRYLALVYQQRSQFEEAETVLQNAIAKAKGQAPMVKAQLYGQRARLQRDRNRPQAAIADLKLALDLFPGFEDQADRGLLLHADKKYQAALSAYEAALAMRPKEIEKRPKVAEIHRLKADVLLSLDRKAEAAAALDQYQETGGKMTTEIYRTRGILRAHLKQSARAQADYTEVIRLQPTSVNFTLRGWLFLSNQANELALQDFEKAIQMDKANADAYSGRALIKARQGSPEQAIADIETALNNAHKKTTRLMWNAAHVYAEIAGRLGMGPGANTLTARKKRANAQRTALALLDEALKLVPPQERASFWESQVDGNQLLAPIHGPGYDSLKKQYRKAK